MYNYQIDVDYDTTSKSETELIKYRTFYLQAMNLKEFDNKQINTIFDDLLPKIQKNFEPIFSLKYGISILDDNWTKLLLLFGFQSFKYMHLCLQDFFILGKIKADNINNLKKSLEYFVKK